MLTLAVENTPLREEALAALNELAPAVPWNESNMLDLSALLSGLHAEPAEILLLDVTAMNGELGTTVRQIRAAAPQTKVVALHREPDAHAILEAMRAGAAEFIYSPLSVNLAPALERIRQTAETDENAPRKGKLVAFLSAKGGCGATTLACHIASELRRQTKKEVLLADLDFTSGIIAFLMKTQSTYSVLDVVRNLGRLDGSLWKALRAQSPCGLSILPAPAAIAHGDYPDEHEFRQVLSFLRTQHDWTIIDLGRSLTRTARSVLEEVDELFLIATLEVMALHGLKSIVRGIGDEHSHKLHLVVNRTPKMMDITVDELTGILGRPLFATLPNDYPSLYHSYAAGTLLPENSRLSEHFARFARRLAGTEEPVKAKKRFSLF